MIPDLVYTRLKECLDLVGSPTHVNIFVGDLDFRSKVYKFLIVEVMSNWHCFLILLRHRIRIRRTPTFAVILLLSL